MAALEKATYRFNEISTKIPETFFNRKKSILKSTWI
jgi:hypothetical protein